MLNLIHSIVLIIDSIVQIDFNTFSNSPGHEVFLCECLRVICVVDLLLKQLLLFSAIRMDLIKSPYHLLQSSVNNAFASKEPFHLITITATSVLATVWFYEYIFEGNEGNIKNLIIYLYFIYFFIDVKEKLKRSIFKLLKLIPQVKKKIETELSKVSQTFEQDVRERTKHLKYITRLPEKGIGTEEILQITDKNLGLGM